MIWAPLLMAFSVAVGSATPLVASGAEPLTDLLASIERAEPLSVPKVEEILGTRLTCEDGFCRGSGVSPGELRIGGIDFRHGTFGSLLRLDRLAGRCLRIDRLKTLYPDGEFVQSCSDALCWYWTVKRPWGALSFALGLPRLPPDIPTTQDCVTSIVFNTSR